MSNTRDESAAKTTIKTSILRHTFISGIATVVVHPLRISLNRAAEHTNPLSTIRDALPRMIQTRGLKYNLMRGTLAASSQSWGKTYGQHHGGLFAGVGLSSFLGTLVAVFWETRLIRMNEFKPAHYSIPLTSLYFLREVCFTLSVLAKNDLPPAAQNVALIGAAALTASLHKLAATEAVRDMHPHVKAPDLREGVGYTIRALANGNVYTHPAFQVTFKNPTTYLAKAANVFNAACGLNMFAFRLLYLYGFREAYHYAAETPTSVSGWAGLFGSNKTVTTEKPISLEAKQPSMRNHRT